MDTDNQNTKSRIFNTALRLFSEYGYEKVSIRDIADAVGIKSASLYYHYENKEKILDACYNFYVEHRHDSRLEKDQYEPIIRNGTKEDILAVINYTFPESFVENMILSLLTILSHLYTDKKAKEIYADDVNRSMQYLEEFFNIGIDVGRFLEFNVPAVSLAFLSARLFTMQSVTIHPEQKPNWRQAELEVYGELINIIPFRY